MVSSDCDYAQRCGNTDTSNQVSNLGSEQLNSDLFVLSSRSISLAAVSIAETQKIIYLLDASCYGPLQPRSHIKNFFYFLPSSFPRRSSVFARAVGFASALHSALIISLSTGSQSAAGTPSVG
jgi:hypothetical protein